MFDKLYTSPSMEYSRNGRKVFIQYFGLIELQYDVEWVVRPTSQSPEHILSYRSTSPKQLTSFRRLIRRSQRQISSQRALSHSKSGRRTSLRYIRKLWPLESKQQSDSNENIQRRSATSISEPATSF